MQLSMYMLKYNRKNDFVENICNIHVLLIISCRRYLDISLQISGINSKVTRLLAFKNIINFFSKISLVTDPDGKGNILWRNIRFRVYTWDWSRFNPTIDTAMSERVNVGNPWMRFTAQYWNLEMTERSEVVMFDHNSEPYNAIETTGCEYKPTKQVGLPHVSKHLELLMKKCILSLLKALEK